MPRGSANCLPASPAALPPGCWAHRSLRRRPVACSRIRYGYKPSLQFALLAQSVAMVLSLIVTTPLGFSIVFALIGAATGLIFATTPNMVVEFATPAERVTY